MTHLTLHHLDHLVKMPQLLHQVPLAVRRRGLHQCHLIPVRVQNPSHDFVVLRTPLLLQLDIQRLERFAGQSISLGDLGPGCLGCPIRLIDDRP